MKQLILAFIISAALISCSKDKDEDPIAGAGAGSEILLTQLVVNYPNNQTFTKQYKYEEGNKLSEIIDSNGNREYYTYEGDFISKIEYRYKDPKFFDERLFTYDQSGKLIEELFLFHFNAVGNRTIFKYDSNHVVRYETFSGNLVSQDMPGLNGTYSLDPKGQILENIEINPSSNTTRTLTYSYDDKNSPFLNIRDGSRGFKFILGGENNTKSLAFTQAGIGYSYASKFEYNKHGYPVSEHKEDNSGTTILYFTYKQ